MVFVERRAVRVRCRRCGGSGSGSVDGMWRGRDSCWRCGGGGGFAWFWKCDGIEGGGWRWEGVVVVGGIVVGLEGGRSSRGVNGVGGVDADGDGVRIWRGV